MGYTLSETTCAMACAIAPKPSWARLGLDRRGHKNGIVDPRERLNNDWLKGQLKPDSPADLMGTSMVSCRFSLQPIHWSWFITILKLVSLFKMDWTTFYWALLLKSAGSLLKSCQMIPAILIIAVSSRYWMSWIFITMSGCQEMLGGYFIAICEPWCWNIGTYIETLKMTQSCRFLYSSTMGHASGCGFESLVVYNLANHRVLVISQLSNLANQSLLNWSN